MTFNHYFFNRGLWVHAWRQGGWIGVVYLLLLIFAGPMQLLSSNSAYEYQNEPRILDYMFQEDGEIAILFTFTMSILMAVFLMRFIQSKRAAEMFHSLPVRRDQLLTVSLVSGLGMLIVPIWITALITGLMAGNLDHVIYTGDQVIDWAVSLTVISLFFFTFTLFVGMCIGQSILQVVVTIILLLLPTGFSFLYIHYFAQYLYGYYRGDRFDAFMTNWSPIERVLGVTTEGFSQQEGWIYLAVALIWIGLSYLFYKYRPTEKATQPIAFRYFNPLFRLGVTLCSALLVGIYGMMFFGKWHVVGCIVGGLLGYLIAEVILRKTWYIFDRKLWRGMVIYGLITAFCIYIPVSPLTGYEKRVPASNNVKAIYVGNSIVGELPFFDEPGKEILYMNKGLLSEDPSYIQSVIDLHAKIASTQPDAGSQHDPNYYKRNERVEIAYVLKDDSRMLRSYMVPLRSEYNPYLQKVRQSKEYKLAFYHLKALEQTKSPITITNPDNQRRTLTITSPSEIAQLHQLIIEEKLAVKDPKHDIIRGNQLVMETSLDDMFNYASTYRYEWNPAFKPTEQWLKKKGYWDLLITKPEDISAILIVPDSRTEKERRWTDYRYLFEKYKKTPQQVIIRNPGQIEELLSKSDVEPGDDEQVYVLKLKFKNGTGSYRVLAKESITPELYSILPK